MNALRDKYVWQPGDIVIGKPAQGQPGHATFSVENPVNHEIAIAGPDGRKVAQLLRKAKQGGAAVLADICKDAFARQFAGRSGGSTLFTDEERKKLEDKLVETLSSASLLGQSAVWLRFMRDEADAGGGEETPFAVFADSVSPLQPTAAIDYFRKLVPMLKAAPDFDAQMRRTAFTLAKATEETLLKKVQDSLYQHLVSGEGGGQQKVLDLLESSGVDDASPWYAETVFRTNMMDAYTQANSETMRDPVIQEAYPCWRYDGIDDGRQGKDHEPKFGKYFPNSASFAEVRGNRPFNCRCSPRPVHWSEWEKLEAAGERVESIW